MLENLVKPYYQRLLLTPILNYLPRRITPTQLTLLGGLMGCLILPLLAFHHIVPAILFLLFSGYLDTLDGSLARHQQTCSPFGTVLDILMDRSVEFSVIMGLWLVDPVNRSGLALMMLGSVLLCVTSFLTVGIFTINTSQKSFHYSAGLMERAEAFIFFIFMMIVPAHFTLLAILFIALVILTTLIRLWEFYHYSRSLISLTL
jgi:archaetidylinositol phosphate synthase